MAHPPVDLYHLRFEDINYDRCIGRKACNDSEADKLSKPYTYYAKQCGRKKIHDSDLCEGCYNLSIQGKINKRLWNGRVTDGYDTIHPESAIAGSKKFYEKHKWDKSITYGSLQEFTKE
jgi:hypothetical protein